jgi:SAM-dependent methyltransferase
MSVSRPPDAPFRTFRDPAGRLEVTGDSVLRHIYPQAAEEARELLASAFYRRCVEKGEVAASQVVPPPLDQTEPEGLTLEHPRVFFPSYCWEWVPSQWLAAGELTLRICEQAVSAGWILKDATPLNILFEGPSPILVDVLSPERRNPKSAIWTVKAQFIRTFLLPLIAHKWLGWPLSASIARRDGITPDELYPALPRTPFFRPLIFWNVVLPTLIDRRTSVTEQKIEATKARESDPEIATALLRRTLRTLGKQLTEATGGVNDSQWRHYTDKLAHYPAADQQEKLRFVEQCLAACSPGTVLDVGTNTGTYAMLAAKAGARVLAIDTDAASVEMLCRNAAAEKADIQALVVNLARPTPAAGWECREQLSFLDRAAGRFQMVFMLAVIHHLLLSEQVPLTHILKLCSELTTRWMILEWVPVTDPMFQQLLRGRGDLYGHLSQDELLKAAAPYFRVERTLALSNGRGLYLFEKTI